MPEIVRCPDCGGIVGATEATDEGPPCTCFGPSVHHADDDSGGTDVMPSQGSQKFCRVCGKDLSGKKRFKDKLGYWCPECAEEDKKRHEEKGTPCAQCGRKVPGPSMTSVDGKLLCSRCVRENRQLREPGNKKFRVISDKSYKETDKKTMIIMGVVLVILLILMAIAWTRRPWAHSRGVDVSGTHVAMNASDRADAIS
jgi:hypothetical protein